MEALVFRTAVSVAMEVMEALVFTEVMEALVIREVSECMADLQKKWMKVIKNQILLLRL
jgi:hypothetical protein